eukprot:4138388-Prorocentrum_lima.AAC.1
MEPLQKVGPLHNPQRRVVEVRLGVLEVQRVGVREARVERTTVCHYCPKLLTTSFEVVESLDQPMPRHRSVMVEQH